MIVKFLQVDHGDAILISFDNEQVSRNILIDSGPRSSYEYGNRPARNGALKIALSELKQANQNIDLLILTHVDDDHIAGILKWFSSSDFNPQFIKKVWFNSGRLINEFFQENLENENLQELEMYTSTQTSINQGVTFESLIEIHGLRDRQLLIKALDTFEDVGVKFTILSPSDEELRSLLFKWEREALDTLTSGQDNDYNNSIEKLLGEDVFQEDNSVHNGSSIALMLEIKSKKLLFLGDAFPSVVARSLHSLGYTKQRPLAVDVVKLSHHGSKGNTSKELLDLIDCQRYVISTNGARHALPHKRTLVRIIQAKPNCKLYFNYPELKDQIFSDEELNSHNFTVYDSKEIIL